MASHRRLVSFEFKNWKKDLTLLHPWRFSPAARQRNSQHPRVHQLGAACGRSMRSSRPHGFVLDAQAWRALVRILVALTLAVVLLVGTLRRIEGRASGTLAARRDTEQGTAWAETRIDEEEDDEADAAEDEELRIRRCVEANPKSRNHLRLTPF
jgi:hypothetical protein